MTEVWHCSSGWREAFDGVESEVFGGAQLSRGGSGRGACYSNLRRGAVGEVVERDEKKDINDSVELPVAELPGERERKEEKIEVET